MRGAQSFRDPLILLVGLFWFFVGTFHALDRAGFGEQGFYGYVPVGMAALIPVCHIVTWNRFDALFQSRSERSEVDFLRFQSDAKKLILVLELAAAGSLLLLGK